MFTVLLPCNKTSAESMETEKSLAAVPHFSSARGVLIVEDDPPSREILAAFVAQLGL